MKPPPEKFKLEEICSLSGINKRKARYYIQKGIVDRPKGASRGAYYTRHHLEQLLAVQKLKAAGLSLKRIREIIHGKEPKDGARRLPAATLPKKAGAIALCSHLYVAKGVELYINPRLAKLSARQVEEFTQGVVMQYQAVKNAGERSDSE